MARRKQKPPSRLHIQAVPSLSSPASSMADQSLDWLPPGLRPATDLPLRYQRLVLSEESCNLGLNLMLNSGCHHAGVVVGISHPCISQGHAWTNCTHLGASSEWNESQSRCRPSFRLGIPDLLPQSLTSFFHLDDLFMHVYRPWDSGGVALHS